MKRFFVLLMSIAALSLVLGTACSKDKEGEAGDKKEEAGKTTETPDDGEKKDEGGDEKADEGEDKADEGGDEGGGDEAMKTGVEECDKLIEQYVKCDKLPQQARDAFMQGAEAWKKSIEAGGDAAKSALTDSCKQAGEAAAQSLKAVGC